MKRTITAIGVGVMVFAAAYGFAASLNVSTDSLGAGSAVVAACQAGTVGVTYAPTYKAAIPGYEATTVTLTGLDETAGACGGKTANVTLTGPGVSNSSLGQQSATLATGAGTTQSFTFTGVSAQSVTGVHVVISG